jgi:hypothetical protein
MSFVSDVSNSSFKYKENGHQYRSHTAEYHKHNKISSDLCRKMALTVVTTVRRLKLVQTCAGGWR